MATIDIGKIKPVFKGTYDNSTAYVLDDIVYYNGNSYVAKTSTTGNLPTGRYEMERTQLLVLVVELWENSTLSIGKCRTISKSKFRGNCSRIWNNINRSC